MLASKSTNERAAAWEVLFQLIGVPGDWADIFAIEQWPIGSCDRVNAAVFAGITPAGCAVARQVEFALRDACPVQIADAIHVIERPDRRRFLSKLASRHPFLRCFDASLIRDRMKVGVLQPGDAAMRLNLISVNFARDQALFQFPEGTAWRAFSPLREFVDAPSTDTLADCVSSLGKTSVLDFAAGLTLPWMLATALNLVANGVDPEELATQIRRGDFGRLKDWAIAEERWLSMGITKDDLKVWERGIYFDERVADVGAPFAQQIAMSVNGRRRAKWLQELVASVCEGDESSPVQQMRHIALFALNEFELPNPLSRAKFRKLLSIPADTYRFSATVVNVLKPASRLHPSVLHDLAVIGQRSGFVAARQTTRLPVEEIAAMVNAAEYPGLLQFACAALSWSGDDLRLLASLIPDRIEVALAADCPPVSAFVLGYASNRVEAAAALTACVGDGSETPEQHALLALAHRPQEQEKDMEILVALINRLNCEATAVRSKAIGYVRRLLDARKSDLDEPATWQALGLSEDLFKTLRLDTSTSASH
jgi:hypothetical protein